MKHLKLIFTVVLILINFSFLQSQVKQSSIQKIDSLFNNYYKPNKTGAAFSIIKKGKVIYKKTRGISNIEHQINITDSTVFNIASISKQFTTYLTLILEKEGKLSINDNISKYLPELKNLPYKITIKHLTNHTHGLPNVDELASLKSVSNMSHKEVVAMALKIKEVNFKPGEQYQYGNTGYVLLSEIIKRVGNDSFENQLREKVFLPLEMKSTNAIGFQTSIVTNKAKSYRILNGKYVYNPVVLNTMGSSGVFTTINDLIVWAKNFKETVVGDSNFYNRMQKPTILNSGKIIQYGLGLQFDTYKGKKVIFHGGGTASYRSYVLHIPEDDLSFIFLSNSGDFRGLDMVYNSIDILFNKKSRSNYKNEEVLNKKQLTKFSGTYELAPSIYYTFFVEKNNLFFRTYGTNEKVPLITLSKNTFKFTALPHSSFKFYKNKMEFHIADFRYDCKKISIKKPKTIRLKKFIGEYKNNAHNITINIEVIKDRLVVKRVFNNNFILNTYSNNSFYAVGFGKLDFIFTKNREISGFKLSGMNFKNISFSKQ